HKDGTVRLLDTTTGKELRRFPGRSGAIASVAFSANGKLLIAQGGEGVVYFWEVATGKETRQFATSAPVAYHAYETGLALSPDGKVLARREEMHALRLWDVASGKEIQRYNGHSGPVSALAFSRDGQRLASAGRHDICLWDPNTGQELGRRPVAVNRELWPAVAFTADDKAVVAATAPRGENTDQIVHRWEVPAGKELQDWTLK